MTVTGRVVPNIVGVDIGCGMYAVNIGHDDIDFTVIDEAAHYVPSGYEVWEERQERFDLQRMRCYRNLKDTRRIELSLGTLGGGNHFIEIDRDSDGTNWLVIHTGSRYLGHQTATYYQRLAIDIDRGKDDYLRRKAETITTYRAKGRHREIQGALKALTWEARESTMPEDLCYLSGEYLDDYIHDVKICQEFARRNREKIAEVLLSRTGLTAYDSFHTIHNYIDTDNMILRKGAISAQSGERVLIPINMRDGSILATGRGNPDWNYSAPHGAGRLMSRGSAKESLSMSDFREAMKGVYTTSVKESTLDESPMAYKPLEAVIDVIAETVDIVSVMKPVYNFKA